jgi:hypothetical protein
VSEADDKLAQFLDGKPIPIDHTLRTLPRTANLELATRAVFRLLDHPHWLAACGELPVHVIRGVLAAKAEHPVQLFLQLAINSDLKAPAMKKAWLAAIEALRELADTRYPLGTDERTSELARLAEQPAVLQAIQGVAANSAEVPIEMLIVLAIDGGDASIDALIPHLDLALGQRDARLERLARVRPFTRATPALAAVFAELDRAVDARRSTSPALAFAKAIGLAVTDVFWCSFLLRSAAGGVPEWQGSVRIDSREDRWFRVELTHLHASDRARDVTTTFDTETVDDALAIGRCEPIDLPAWLRMTATTQQLSWDRFYVRSNLDPKPIETWLIV